MSKWAERRKKGTNKERFWRLLEIAEVNFRTLAALTFAFALFALYSIDDTYNVNDTHILSENTFGSGSEGR